MAGIEVSNVKMLVWDRVSFAPLAHEGMMGGAFPGSFVPVFVPMTGTNAKHPSQGVALQQLAKGV